MTDEWLGYGLAPNDGAGDTLRAGAIKINDLLYPSVISRVVTAPPVEPSEGDKYLVPIGATGLWASFAGKLAAFRDGDWRFYDVSVGFHCWVLDEGKMLIDLGSGLVAALVPGPKGDKGDAGGFPEVSGPDKILGRVSLEAGPVEEIACSGVARSFLAAVDKGAQRAALELPSTKAGKGASLIGIEDSAGNYDGENVETALAEAAGKAGKVLQVVTGFTTSQLSTTSTDWQDILSVAITPKKVSSKVLIFITAVIGVGGADGSRQAVFRDTIQILQGATVAGAASVSGPSGYSGSADSNNNEQVSIIGNDEPNTTDEVVYRFKYSSPQGVVVRVNDLGSAVRSTAYAQVSRTDIILMEIAQ